MRGGDSLVIVPVGEVSRLTQHVLSAARALGHEVVAVAVHADPAKVRTLRESWDRWNPGVRLDVVDSPQRSLVEPIVAYVRRAEEDGRSPSSSRGGTPPPPLSDPPEPARSAPRRRAAAP